MPRMSMVRSLVPKDMPSIPSSTNLSISKTVAGTSTMIQSLKSGPRFNPSSSRIFFAFLKSSSVRTKGSITWTLVSLYSSRTFLMAWHSNRKMSGSLTYRKQPRYPNNGLGPTCLFVFIFFAAWKSEKLVRLEVQASIDDGSWGKGCCHLSDSLCKSIHHLLAASLFYQQSGLFSDREHHVLCSQRTYAVRVRFPFDFLCEFGE